MILFLDNCKAQKKKATRSRSFCKPAAANNHMAQEPCPPQAGDSLVEAAIKVLACGDPWRKSEWTRDIVRMWRSGEISSAVPVETAGLQAPDRPARLDDKVKLVAPGQVPKLGKGGSLASRQALVHSLCHIESWAIDLAWDIIARFGLDPRFAPHLPRGFYDDFVTVADDECRHFLALEQRLRDMGSAYGALPAHDGLWESAATTAHSLPARLAVEHCVHEARGLDVLPSTIAKFRNNGDEETAALLEGTIYPEEVDHCGAGVRWLRHLHAVARSMEPQAHAQGASGAQEQAACSGTSSNPGAGEAAAAAAAGGLEQQGPGQGERTCCPASWVAHAQAHASVELWFHALIRSHFHGSLKPPFNEMARAKAGFEPGWYLPLVGTYKSHGATAGVGTAGFGCGAVEA